jgi:hypothetical protein
VKFFNYALFLISLLLSFYSLYLAIFANEGAIPTFLRCLAAISMFVLTIMILKERNISRNQSVSNWYNRERQKGFWHYIIFSFGIGWGLPIGFVTWVMSVDFTINTDLILSASIHMFFYLMVGFFIGCVLWSGFKKDARKLGLDRKE